MNLSKEVKEIIRDISWLDLFVSVFPFNLKLKLLLFLELLKFLGFDTFPLAQ